MRTICLLCLLLTAACSTISPADRAWHAVADAATR